MGEYAKLDGKQVKIGTCENMYYLRADQRTKVQPLSGNVNPATCSEIRFRFPWPDEDGVAPGAFEPYNRHLGVSLTFTTPLEYEHGNIQFVAQCGMLLSIPCPLGPNALRDLPVHKNGWRGDVLLVQTAYREGEWRVVCECGGCGYPFNLPRAAAAELAEAILKNGQHGNVNATPAPFYVAVAARVMDGYKA